MNLLEKSLQYQKRHLPLVLLGCTALFFLLLKIQTTHLQEVQLLLKQENVLNRFPAGRLDTSQSIAGEYTITTGHAINPKALREPTDTLIYYPFRKEYVPFQMRTTLVEREGQIFQLTTYVSSVEITHLIIAVLTGQFVIYLILFVAILKINQRASKVLWKPFYQTMKALEKYEINTHQTLDLKQEADISEFNELNSVINELVERNRRAYLSQKEFVENASHEIQTPLAIIRSKIDLLMEEPTLEEKSAGLIGEIAQANNRLSSLNRILILLSKIENAQFIQTGQVNLSTLLETQLCHLQGYYLDNSLTITQQMEENVVLTANPELLDIMCSNLLRNAFVHNIESGYLHVSLTRERLLIENSGKPLKVNPQLLFERFRTGDPDAKKTLGLGLALVKQICLLYHFEGAYTHDNGIHRITIRF